MPLPPGVTTRTYTGTIVGLDGTNATGILEFRHPQPIYYVATVGGATEADSGTVAVGTPTGITVGGRSSSDGTEFFNGRIAQMRIWTAELSQAEIEAEWAVATHVRTSGLWTDWPLTGVGDLNDASGNGRHLSAGTTAVTTEDEPPNVSSGNPRAADFMAFL